MVARLVAVLVSTTLTDQDARCAVAVCRPTLRLCVPASAAVKV
jgi:hypothetical protein